MKNVSASLSSLILVLAALVVALPAEATSLWGKRPGTERGLVADRVAANIGDILTVVVQENATAQASLRTSTDSKTSMNDSISRFFFTPDASGFGTHNGVLPSLSLQGQREFSGGGAINNRQAVTARSAVLVVDVLPNGNFVIEGSRLVLVSGERQYAVLRGLVRPQDITSGNTILSSNIAEAHVEFINEGTLRDAQRKGWLSRILDVINPF